MRHLLANTDQFGIKTCPAEPRMLASTCLVLGTATEPGHGNPWGPGPATTGSDSGHRLERPSCRQVRPPHQLPKEGVTSKGRSGPNPRPPFMAHKSLPHCKTRS